MAPESAATILPFAMIGGFEQSEIYFYVISHFYIFYVSHYVCLQSINSKFYFIPHERTYYINRLCINLKIYIKCEYTTLHLGQRILLCSFFFSLLQQIKNIYEEIIQCSLRWKLDRYNWYVFLTYFYYEDAS